MKIVSLIRWIAIAVLGIVLTVIGVIEFVNLKKAPKDLTDPETDWTELAVGDHVKMNLNALFDPFVITTKDDGTETMRDYAMPQLVYSESGDSINIRNYIGIHVNDKDLFADYDRLAEETVDWWLDDEAFEFNPQTIEIDGIVKEMDDESIGYFKEYLEDMGYEDDFIEDTCYKYAVYPAQTGLPIIMIIGVLVTLFGIGATVFSVIKRK